MRHLEMRHLDMRDAPVDVAATSTLPVWRAGDDGSASLACLAGSSDGTTSETMTDPLFPVRAALIPYPG